MKTTNGVLPSQHIQDLITERHIVASHPFGERQVQPATLDLRLGARAHPLQASFSPGENASVREKLQTLGMTSVDLSSGAVLETGCLYLVELMEELALPEDVSGKANPKSTTGRLDVFTKLVTDRSNAFDLVAPGYHGRLYADVMPRTFPVIVREGGALSQIRFSRGTPALTDRELVELDEAAPLTFRDAASMHPSVRNGIRLRVNLEPGKGGAPVAYRGAHNARIVDLLGKHPIEGYWETSRSCPNGQLILNPGEFYILSSLQRVRVPPDHAAEMVPYDPSMGELRVHYAGFFDPGFGWETRHRDGTPAVLEVRAHDTPFVLEHGQAVARLEYSRMLAMPDQLYGSNIGSTYHEQDLSLGKQFHQ